MFESIGRSIALFRTSWGILMDDKKLLIFPFLSGVAILLLFAIMFVPLFLSTFLEVTLPIPGGAVFGYALLFVVYLGCYFAVIFFNTALVCCADARLSGRDLSVREGIAIAFSHLPAILSWALVSATIGLILGVLSQRGGIFGKIAAAVAGFAWNVSTYFVVPVLVFEGKGVSDAIRESVFLIRKTWGESILGFESVSFVMSCIIGIAIVGTVILLVLGNSLHLAADFILLILALGIVSCIILGVIAVALQGIYTTALYQFARTGNVPAAFSQDQIRNASVRQ